MAKQPKIRFKGFTEEWKRDEAHNFFYTYCEKNHPELPVLAATQEKGMVIRDAVGYQIAHNRSNEVTYKRVLPGQFVVHLRSFQGGFAHSNVEGITSPAYEVFGLKNLEMHDDYFWKYIFCSKAFIKRLEKVTYGIRDGRSISYPEFLELPFSFPSKAEQKAISSFITKLTTTISKRETELEKLKNIKRALFEKLFPQDGQSIPAIRFKEFVDKWEPKVLGNEIEETGTKNRNNLPLESYSITNEAGFIPQTEKFENGGYLTDADKTMYTIVPPKSFAYNPARINVGSIGYYNGSKDVIVSSLYIVFKTSEAIHDDFLMAWFKSDIFNHLIYKLQEGGVRQYFFYDKIVQCPILLPKNPEQEKIAKLVNSLNKTISLRERQLTLLKHSKQALLEQMFVNE